METYSRHASNEDLILEDCVLSLISTDEQQDSLRHCQRLAALLGATVSEQILPAFTTHVVTQLITPLVKNQLNTLQARAIEAVNKQNRGLQGGIEVAQLMIVGHSHTIKLVT